MGTCAQHEAELQAALARVRELEAWLDGKEHRHESGKICVACVPQDEADADRIEKENARLEGLVAELRANLEKRHDRHLAEIERVGKRAEEAEALAIRLKEELRLGIPQSPPPLAACAGLDWHFKIKAENTRLRDALKALVPVAVEWGARNAQHPALDAARSILNPVEGA